MTNDKIAARAARAAREAALDALARRGKDGFGDA